MAVLIAAAALNVVVLLDAWSAGVVLCSGVTSACL